MNKCLSCLHATRVDELTIHCNYFRCIKEDGWIADKRRGANDKLRGFEIEPHISDGLLRRNETNP